MTIRVKKYNPDSRKNTKNKIKTNRKNMKDITKIKEKEGKKRGDMRWYKSKTQTEKKVKKERKVNKKKTVVHSNCSCVWSV